MSKHTLSILVENKPGILARIAALFARRGFNIDSLAVGPTEYPSVSRMTVVVDVEDQPLEQVTKQLNKLINVIKIVELGPGQAVQRELLLLKVRADLESLLRVLEPFGIRELVQSGVVAVGRGSRSITDRTLRPIDRTA